MQKRVIPFLLALIVGVSLFAFSRSVTANYQENTLIEIRPASGAYDPGDEIEVQVWVVDVVDLYAADVQLSFDPAELAVIDAEVTPVNDLLQPDFVVRELADNQTGLVWYAATQLNPTEPATGSGALFTFTFEVLSDGISDVIISEQILATRNADIIPATLQNARYLLGDVTFQIFAPIIFGK